MKPARTFRLRVTADYSAFCGFTGTGRPNACGWWVVLDGYDQEVPFGAEAVVLTDCSLPRCTKVCEYSARCVQGARV